MKVIRDLLRLVFVIPGRICIRIGLLFYATPVELHELNVPRWFRARGDQTYRLIYQLDSSSIVFDVGGYHGDWAADILSRYQCRVYIFEPLPQYITMLKKRFLNNKNVFVHPVGLSGKTRSEVIGLLDNASSTFKTVGPSTTAKFQDIVEIFQQTGIQRIDLIKINIEGGEYELLERLIETGLVKKIVNIQVQFHEFVSQAEIRRNKIRTHLAITHRCTYNFPFVWENWKCKS